MSALRLPIYAKVLLWFLLNLLLLAILGYAFITTQFKVGLDWMLAGPTGQRIEELANGLTADLAKKPESEWSSVLSKQSATHGITFALFSSDGSQVLGDAVEVPREVRAKLIDRRNPNDTRPSPPPRLGAAGKGPSSDPLAPPKPRFILRSERPTRYWAGIHIDLVYRDGPRLLPLTVVMISKSLTAGGLFFDPWPWIALAAGGLFVSVLMWLPFVSGMTRAIHRLNVAARTIAEGKFEARVPERRTDELGELAASVNTMAGQLGDYVQQQRRITGDIAHELCSPIARMQMALGVIEQRGVPEQATYLQKLDRELQHMSKLVEEVLSFTKAAHSMENREPEDLRLNDLLLEITAREAAQMTVQLTVPPDLAVHAPLEPLDRALGNIVRNAVRYAGQAGTLDISAHREGERVVIALRDHGPGVPEEALPQIFEPFFRVDPARGRGTGGTGLGLAIVKRCVEACSGTVTAKLASPGLCFEITVPGAMHLPVGIP